MVWSRETRKKCKERREIGQIEKFFSKELELKIRKSIYHYFNLILEHKKYVPIFRLFWIYMTLK